MVISSEARDRIKRFKKEFKTDPHRLLDSMPDVGDAKWRGPHAETIRLRNGYSSPSEAANSTLFVSNLLKTLKAWDWGKRGASPVPHCQFRSEVRRAAGKVDYLGSMRLDEIGDVDAEQIGNALWKTISELQMTGANAKLVYGTKAVHHLLPQLIPPMDGNYTAKFFGTENRLYTNEKGAFNDMFHEFVHLARTLAPQLKAPRIRIQR